MNAQVSPTLRPLLKWVGGKRWLAERMKALYAGHEHRVYQEPFAGGLAIALALRPERAIVSDLNPHLIHFYELYRSGLAPLDGARNDSEFYYSARASFNSLVRMGLHSTVHAAQLFGYLNKTGFNGLCRFNRKGEFNVPFGRFKSIDYSIPDDGHRDLMKNWEFRVEDFRDMKLVSGSFVYCDPPYLGTFNGYTPEKFDDVFHETLADIMLSHDGPVVVSNCADPRILEIYGNRGFHVQIIDAPRSVSAKGDGRKKVPEMLATRNVDLQAKSMELARGRLSAL